MHQLQLHEILLKICHCVAELCKSILEAFERIAGRRCATTTLDAVA
jgi:hypothetical protein